jgi:hypothetical protein
MKKTSFRLALVLLAAVSALLMNGCSSSSKPSGPKDAVIKFFGAMESNDQAALAHLLDLTELMKNAESDYAINTASPRTFVSPKDILDDLTNDGKTKRLWFSMQRIVNTAEVTDGAAQVEVTFIDKEASRGYMTKFGLHLADGKWKIYSFKTTEQAGQ